MPRLQHRKGAVSAPAVAHRPAEDDRAWYEGAFRQHYPALCSYVERFVGSAEAAEDLVQDLFVTVWDRRAEWRARGSALAPLLYTSARNRAFNALKRRRLEDRSRLFLDLDECAPGGADEALRSGEVEDAIRRAVDALPEQCRLIFTLNRRDGLTYSQIAQSLQLSVKTVETQMGRALRALRTRLAVHLAASVILLLSLVGWMSI